MMFLLQILLLLHKVFHFPINLTCLTHTPSSAQRLYQILFILHFLRMDLILETIFLRNCSIGNELRRSLLREQSFFGNHISGHGIWQIISWFWVLGVNMWVFFQLLLLCLLTHFVDIVVVKHHWSHCPSEGFSFMRKVVDHFVVDWLLAFFFDFVWQHTTLRSFLASNQLTWRIIYGVSWRCAKLLG